MAEHEDSAEAAPPARRSLAPGVWALCLIVLVVLTTWLALRLSG